MGPGHGATAVIRQFVKNLERGGDRATPSDLSLALSQVLQDSHKEEIVKAALLKHFYAEELKPFQAELIKMQAHLERMARIVGTSKRRPQSHATFWPA